MTAFPGLHKEARAPLAEAVDITKRFGATVALRNVSLAIEPGESHGLVGRNGAGKSTLVSVFTGLHRPDTGQVRFAGDQAPALAHRERWLEKVACVYQKSTVLENLTVGENLVLNAYPRSSGGLVRWKTLRREAAALLEEWKVGVSPDAPATALSVGQRQLVEVARALRLGSKFIILDEPTAQLEAKEIELLFDHMARLHAQGVSFLYISHHLSEVFEMCQRVTVLRDGRLILTGGVGELTKEDVVRAMVGSAISESGAAAQGSRAAADEPGVPVVLSVRGLTVAGRCRDVDLDVRAGERVGLTGLAGSGKSEVADAIVGMVKADAGTVTVGGAPLKLGRVDAAIARGIAYVPQDRHARGLAPNLSVEENLTLCVLPTLGPGGIVDPRRRRRTARALLDRLKIVASGPRQLVSELSGGNQQKTVMGRALASRPRVLVMVNPTAGVDIASKVALYETILDVSDAAVLLASDELEELKICHRLLVMFDGRIVEEFTQGWSYDEVVATMEGVRL